ncbi:cyclase family protein [Microbacterium sp. LWH3-1.2]
MGEHRGTHIDVPIHWITGPNGRDVSETPLPRLGVVRMLMGGEAVLGIGRVEVT